MVPANPPSPPHRRLPIPVGLSTLGKQNPGFPPLGDRTSPGFILRDRSLHGNERLRPRALPGGGTRLQTKAKYTYLRIHGGNL